ncbi:MAG: hypothetical protein ACE5JR_00740 [Gemmatimonadota bacterium]
MRLSKRGLARALHDLRFRPLRGPAGWLLVGAVVAAGLFRAFRDAPLPDVAWYLYSAERVLDGARLYVDLFDTNPPLIVWLNLTPALLGRLTGISHFVFFNLLVAALALGSLAAVRWLCRDGGRPTVTYLLLLVAFVFLPLSRGAFGQREHLMLMLVTPYFLATALRASGATLPRLAAAAIGVAGGLGFALKPHFLVPLLAGDGYAALVRRRPDRASPDRSRTTRPESAIAYAVIAGYGLVVLLVSPRYLDMAAAVVQVYGAFDVAMEDLVRSPQLIWAGASLALFSLLRPAPPYRELSWVLALATAGFTVAAFLQGKGWTYQLYPPLAAASVLAGVTVWAGAEGAVRVGRGRAHEEPSGQHLSAIGAVGSFMAVLGMVGILVLSGATAARHPEARGSFPALARLVRENASADEAVVALSAAPVGFPLVSQTGVRWGSRFLQLWPLPGLYADVEPRASPFPYHPPHERPELERWLVNVVVEDLLRERPALLIVESARTKSRLGATAFDYVEYFSQDTRFAEIFQSYDRLSVVGAFTVYRRRCEPEHALAEEQNGRWRTPEPDAPTP